MKVILTCGLPGSGKSTLSKKLCETTDNTIIISRDFIRAGIAGSYENYDHSKYESYVKKTIKSMISLAFSSNINIIIDEVNMNKKVRADWIRYCKLLAEEQLVPLTIVCVYVDVSIDKCKERRRIDTKNTNTNWDAIIENMSESFEVPNEDEGFDKLYTTGELDYDKFIIT